DTLEARDLVVPAALVPHMVAERDGVHAEAEQGLRDGPVDAGTRRRVLGIGDHKIDAVLAPQARHPRSDDVPPRASDDVANEKNTNHGAERAPLCTRDHPKTRRGIPGVHRRMCAPPAKDAADPPGSRRPPRQDGVVYTLASPPGLWLVFLSFCLSQTS